MFDKFKQMKQLRDLQQKMQAQRIEQESGGVKVVINGSMQVEQIEIAEGMEKGEIATNVKTAINDGMMKMQKQVAGMMRESGIGM